MLYPLPPVLLALVTVLSLTQMNIQRHSIRWMFKKTRKQKCSWLQLSHNTLLFATRQRLDYHIPLFVFGKKYM